MTTIQGRTGIAGRGEPQDSRTRARTKQKRDPNSGLYVTKLTDDVLEAIVLAMASGVVLETAAAFAGVSRSRLLQWLADGRSWLEEHPDGLGANGDPADAPMQAQLVQRVEVEMAKFEIGIVGTVVKAAGQDWRAGVAILDRTRPDRYGTRTRLDIGNPPGEEFKFAGRDLSVLPPDLLEALRKALIILAEHERGGEVIDMPRRRELGTGT